jgi:vacuolar-type H+-ATPase subunit E/Vma4
MMLQAREEVALMIEQTEIVATARREAEAILASAEAEAVRERDEIENYIDSRLANLEVVLTKSLEVIAKGREKLQGSGEASALNGLAGLIDG